MYHYLYIDKYHCNTMWTPSLYVFALSDAVCVHMNCWGPPGKCSLCDCFQNTNRIFCLCENMNSVVLTQRIALCQTHFILFPTTLHKGRFPLSCSACGEPLGRSPGRTLDSSPPPAARGAPPGPGPGPRGGGSSSSRLPRGGVMVKTPSFLLPPAPSGPIRGN